MKIRPQNQPSWESKSQTLYRAGERAPEEVAAKQATYDFAPPRPDLIDSRQVIAFVDPASGHVWIGPVHNFHPFNHLYIVTKDGIVGLRLTMDGVIVWRESLADVRSSEKLSLEEVIARFGPEIDFARCESGYGSPGEADKVAMREWSRRHGTDLRDHVFKPNFFLKHRSGGQQLGDTKIVGVTIEGDEVRLDLKNEAAKCTGSVWIDISSRKVTKAVDGDVQTCPKKTAGGPSK